MANLRHTVPLALILALIGSSSRAEVPAPRPKARESAASAPGMAGRVTGRATPLVAAGVYAYQIADKSLHKVLTDPQGNFLFSDLPAGLYQVIAHKPGFVPAVVMVTRATARSFQFLELQLAEQRRAEPVAGEGGDFWSVRARIPTDVLRDIAAAEQPDFAYSFSENPGNSLSRFSSEALGNFHTDIQAMTGVDQVADLGAGQLSGGQVGLSGRVGPVQVGLSGKFLTLSTGGGATLRPAAASDGSAQASSLALDLTAGASSRISLSSANNRLFASSRTDGPVDFERYHLSWSQAYSDTSRSDFAAVYVAENNYHRQGGIDPREIPDSSRTWKVEGAYTTDLGDGSSLQAGMRYRERQIGVDRAVLVGDPAQASIDLFGKGRQRLRPAVMVEYGLYSTLSDGSLALAPQGSLLLKLGNEWSLDATAGKRVYEDRHGTPDFLPMLYSESDLCGQASEDCYKIQLSKGDAKADNRLSLSAASRTVGETLRLYFSDEFFDRLESVYLVPGDRLPEMQVGITRRLTPQVITTLESTLASGGGGSFVSADRHSYKNQVRYLVTSLDTHFQSTSTGVFVAFHHVDQNLEPVDTSGSAAESLGFERLQLRLSQDLGVLMSVASDWTVQLNFELSRASSSTLTNQDNKVMRRILGGFAVKF